MPQRRKPTGIVKLGFGIAVAAFVAILFLGFSVMTVPQPAPDSPVASIGCGSVFVPEDEPLCDDGLSRRKTLVVAIGIPGVAIGLGIVIAASRLQHKRR
jgi:hypothetical protein